MVSNQPSLMPLSKHNLRPLPTPIAIKLEYISKTQTVLQITQSSLVKRNYTVYKNNALLFTIKGKGFWHYSHDVIDISGLPVFEIRRQWSKSAFWKLQIPDSGKELGRGSWNTSWTNLKYEFVIKNKAIVGQRTETEGPQTKIEVRGMGVRQIVFDVFVNGAVVAIVHREVSSSRAEQGWEVRVAEGFDLSLAAAIAVAIGDYISTQRASTYGGVGAGGGGC